MNILYIHGFRSSAAEKNKQFKKVFPDANIISFECSYNPMNDVERILNIINSVDGEIYVIGTSLGGFYAMCALAYNENPDAFFIPINVAWEPHLSLAEYIDQELPCYYDETKIVKLNSVALTGYYSYSQMLKYNININSMRKFHYIHSTHDEILGDNIKFRNFIKRYGGTFTEVDAGHRLNDITPIVNIIKSRLK